MLGGLRLTAIGGLPEQEAVSAELRVGGGLVLDVGRGSGLVVAAKEFDLAEAILAAELGVAVGQGIGDSLDLPEWLVASAGFDAATFYFALVDLLAFDCHYCPVPPTVMRSSFTVGMPTPTGTLCPALPQVPIPSSRARSFPTIETYFNASGPLPINVAPFTGRVTMPSSIR